MRSLCVIPLLSAMFPLLGLVSNTIASPLALEEPGQEASVSPELEIGPEDGLEKRCANPCGSTCCGTSQTCSTNSGGQAVCADGSGGSGGGGGDWHYWTTTYIVTEVESSTITSVMSSQLRSVATGTATGSGWGSGSGSGTCRAQFGETMCGSTCCEAAQECDNGQCVAESSSAAVTEEPTPGVRGTSSGASTVTQTSAPTTTQGFIAPVGTDGADLIGAKASSEDGGGLSGGAIAGIVVGTIAGVVLLLLLCGCLCFRGALLSLLAALGLRKRNRRDTTYVEERRSHHSHGSRPRPQGGRTWFGTRPHAGTESSVSEKKKSKWSGWGTVAIILGALALCLGLKRHRDREHDDDDKTSYTYPSTYYYSDYTRSSDSSGGRTRDTRRTRRSRTRSRRS